MGEAFELEVEGDGDALSRIAEFVKTNASRLGLNPSAAFRMQMAVDEASANAIEHAYAGKQGRLQVRLWKEQDTVCAAVVNWGDAFDPQHVPTPDLARGELDGLGIYLMRRLVDEVSFSFDSKKGNVVTLKKRVG